jgi:hypothetical protein
MTITRQEHFAKKENPRFRTGFLGLFQTRTAGFIRQKAVKTWASEPFPTPFQPEGPGRFLVSSCEYPHPP